MARLFLAVLLATAAFTSAPAGARQTGEIVFDQWGVPHVRAESFEQLGYGYGYSQAHAHGELLALLYARGRGTAARHFGASEIDADLFAARFNVPERARDWLEAQSPDMRAYLEAFAEGVNAAAAGQDGLSEAARAVFPVSASDVLGHYQQVMFEEFVAGRTLNQAARQERGSNAMAIGPSRSESGHALLLANPHLPWAGQFLFHEAHLMAPGLNVHGATLVGFPFLVIGFNEALGWTHTVNTYDGADTYELTLDEGGYLLDGERRAFETETVAIQIAGEEEVETRTFEIERSVHGPVIARGDGHAYAVRIAGLDSSAGIVEQYFDMARARDFETFRAAYSRMNMAMLNLVYADRDGHIYYVHSGAFPVREQGDFAYWQGIIPGHDSALIWTEYHPFDALPQFSDPESGFIQNTNEPPWTSTFPRALDPADYPANIAPVVSQSARTTHALRLATGDESISFEEFRAYSRSPRHVLADLVMDDLVAAARAADDPRLHDAADRLEAWDRTPDPDDRVAPLFSRWAYKWFDAAPANIFRHPEQAFAVGLDLDDPLNTPRGLADPDAAAALLLEAYAEFEAAYGRVDVTWDEYVSVAYAGTEIPAVMGDGLHGAFQVGFLAGGGDVPARRHVGGETAIFLVEFAETVRAQGLLVYGNATREGSPHIGDQLELYAEGAFREIVLDPAWIEAHAVSRVNLER